MIPKIIVIIDAPKNDESNSLNKLIVCYHRYQHGKIPRIICNNSKCKKNSFIISHFERTLFYGK